LLAKRVQYLRPDEVALVASGSQILQDCIDKNWLIVINVIDGERVPPPVTTKKKKATTPPAENS
jgi:hypothetical protein